MSRTPMYDPLTSDARSSWLAGLTEACNKLSGVLDMKVQTFTNLTLPELYIEENDRFRIYQAPLGNKLWLTEPAPVIKKNGTVITPENDGFTIDYLGGSIAFEDSRILTEWDVITADASYIVDESNKISSILASIDTIEEEAGKNKGAFNTVSDLEVAYPNASAGDFAIVSSENAIYIWDDTEKEWVNANAKVDLTSYFTKTEINALLDEKQDTILAKEIPSGSSESATDYFYAGNKTWVSLIAKIKGCALSGLVTSDGSQVEEADTLLEAIGKLQAQINSFIHPIVGNSAPTTSTVGIVGQDYINKSNGDKYRLISIEGSGTSKTYIWQKYGATAVTNFTISIPSSEWSNKSCTISNSNIHSGTEYTYFIGPSDSSYKDYNECGIYADDITANGSITFHASETPTISISVDICKMSGSTNGGKVYNVGGGGGSNKNAVTVDGGGHMTMEEVFGPPPYEIEFTEEEPEDIVQNLLSRGFLSNPNLLDNWYFADPENQREQTEYSGENYGIDRWVGKWTGDGILAVIDPGTKDGCISLYRSSHSAQLCQFVENARGFAGKTLTFSALTKMELGGRSSIIIYVKYLGNDDLVSISGSVLDDFTEYGLISCSAVIPEDAVELMVDITSSNAKKSFFKAVKLELGTNQTLAHQDASGNWVLNDPLPDKTLELLKCQRYYQVFSSADIRPTKAVDFRPPMRVDPALSTIEIDGVTYYTASAEL